MPTQGSGSVSTQTAMGSSTRVASPVALSGYCPVCVVDMKKWVKGSPDFAVTHRGKTYYFPGSEQKQKFLANLEKYTPALDGDCAVCKMDMKKDVAGSVMFTALHKDRLFMFPSEDIKNKFMRNPAKYEAVTTMSSGSGSKMAPGSGAMGSGAK